VHWVESRGMARDGCTLKLCGSVSGLVLNY
jgi:hypothetical protein